MVLHDALPSCPLPASLSLGFLSTHRIAPQGEGRSEAARHKPLSRLKAGEGNEGVSPSG